MLRSSCIKRRRARSAQAAVEIMLLAFMVTVILVSMFHLFTVTWANQNAHMRAREALLHDTTYLSQVGDGRASFASGGSGLWGGSNYNVATHGYPAARVPIDYRASANDTTPDDIIGSQTIQVATAITEFSN